MHRVDTSTAAAALPANDAVGTPGYFTKGDPVGGIPATVPGQDFLNAVQEELVGIVLASGLTPNKADRSQVLQALRRLMFSTGDVKLTIKNVADPGWVIMNDGSIGNAASGATTRANADTQALFELVWNNIINTWCPVQDSIGAAVTRGASATADFNANRRIVLPRVLGRALAAAGAGTGLTSRQLGQYLGTETHLLSQTETPLKSHTHGVSDPGHAHGVTDTGHIHNIPYANATGGAGISSESTGNVADGNNNTSASLTGISINGAATGVSVLAAGDSSVTAHNNMPPESFWNVMIKL